MPVTLHLVDHPPTTKDVKGLTGAQILDRGGADEILQCSIGGYIGAQATQFKVLPNQHGFVHTVLSAYTDSHELVLRPDDIWLAIISQFILYYNHTHPRQATHEPLRLSALFSRKKIAKSMKRNFLERHPDLSDWVLPSFATSMQNDITVASALLMSSCSSVVGEVESLSHTETQRRGIPRVTLEGRRSDWQLLLDKLEMLKEHGIPAIAWFHLLHPVISQLLHSFDAQAVTPAIREFWKTVIHREGFGGKAPRLTGWITAFCVFSCDGQFCGPTLKESPRRPVKKPAELPSMRFWAKYATSTQQTGMQIGGTNYPAFEISNLPTSRAAVNITVKLGDSTSVPCLVVAGLTGVGFSSSGKSSDPKRLNDIVRPVVAWWIVAPAIPESDPQVE